MNKTIINGILDLNSDGIPRALLPEKTTLLKKPIVLDYVPETVPEKITTVDYRITGIPKKGTSTCLVPRTESD